MPSKTGSRTPDNGLKEEVEKLQKIVESGLRAHERKINDLEMSVIARLRDEIRDVAKRVRQIEQKLAIA